MPSPVRRELRDHGVLVLTLDRPPANAIDEALAAKELGEERVILFNYSGHGFLDMAAYDDYLAGRRYPLECLTYLEPAALAGRQAAHG